MRPQYYQVTGNTPLVIDYPNGESKAHRPGAIVKVVPSNSAVQRGLRIKRLRQLSDREANALRNAELAVIKQGPPPPTVKTKTDDIPIVVLDDDKPGAK